MGQFNRKEVYKNGPKHPKYHLTIFGNSCPLLVALLNVAIYIYASHNHVHVHVFMVSTMTELRPGSYLHNTTLVCHLLALPAQE